MAPARKIRPFIVSFAPVDHGYRLDAFARKRGRAGASGNLRGKRLQAESKLGVGDLAQPFAKLLRNRPKLRPLWANRIDRRLALAEHDPVDRRITEEAVHPLDDHRR